jgi:Flp pilus assembly pilin Flp
VPHISGKLAQISGAGHGATAIGAGLTAGFVTLVIVGIIISIVEWIKNHPLLFILAAGFAIYAWVHSHSSP